VNPLGRAMKRTAMPSGAPPPEEAGGLDLRAMAERVTDRYGVEFPDEDERYEPRVWRAWCRHDSQYLLQWAVLDAEGATSLQRQVDWLAGVLEARGFPLDRLARTLELCADEADTEDRADAASSLRDAAGGVRSR
jgi:hypothetical protein